MDAFLTGLETHAGESQATYSWDPAFYQDYLVELRSARLRAQSDDTNEFTAKQVTLMMDNLEQLRLAHEAGPFPFPRYRPHEIYLIKDGRPLLREKWRKGEEWIHSDSIQRREHTTFRWL